MRRCVAGILLLLLFGQSAGLALADGNIANSEIGNTASLTRYWHSLLASIDQPAGARPSSRYRPPPPRAEPDYRDPRRYARLVTRASIVTTRHPTHRPLDLIRLQRATRSRHLNARLNPMSLAPSVTGILPWWTYQARSIPGAGQAMVNVANLNLLLVESDMNIPEGGLDLSFRRIYNSESGHDANNDDGSTPSVFGNGWTNNLDVHLGWIAGLTNSGTASVYEADGARDDYVCQTTVAATCTPQTPGVHAILATTQVTGGVACQLQWTKPSGTSYVFNAPYAACGNGAGQYGRLISIYGRNATYSIQLAYSWNPDASNAENLTKIVATHQPDGSQLILNFGQIKVGLTELASIKRPDGEFAYYHYDNAGNLTGVDKPGNSPVLVNQSVPTQFADGSPIAAGNLPETYDVETAGIAEVCGPRAAITILNGNTHNLNKADGACGDFDYNNKQLTDWWTRGVLNPTPRDNVLTPSAIQNGPDTGFVQWDVVSFSNGIIQPPCSSLAEMSDVYNHLTQWCYDGSARVVQTSVTIAGSTSLTTEYTWDASNNLTSSTDARGNTTNTAFDNNGNVVEISLPQQDTSIGSIRPTSLYDYDGHNNVIAYCDPANNANNAWNPNPGPTPCASSHSAHYTRYVYTSDPGQTNDPNEPYGCVVATYKPSGYYVQTKYDANNSCGVGEPITVLGQNIQQDDGSQRQPVQNATYNLNGTMATYSRGNGTWTLTYTSNGMNRLRSRTDPDGVKSDSCYNLNGSTFYTETALQNQMDGSPGCPTTAQLVAGATPPTYAVAYGYDADGDVATETTHHNCTTGTGNCAAKTLSASWCTPNVSIAAGTKCSYYDGLDRLVEVKQPQDSTFDFYQNPWVTRYLYDLTGAPVSFSGQNFSAYGNLYETQELLPPGGGLISAIIPYSPGFPTPPPNNTYVGIKATSYDGIDRPTTRFSMVDVNGSEQLSTESLTWDTSPLNPNVAGLLGSDCNALNKCTQFDYRSDGEQKTFSSSDSSAPTRTYLYDPDGRATSITSGAYSNPQLYTYDVDGNLSTAIDPSGANNPNNAITSPATLTYHRYLDGSEESLDVSSSALTQIALFSYSYRKDGLVKTETVNDTSLGNTIIHNGQTSITNQYTSAGRLTERDESGVAAYPTPTQMSYDATTGLLTSESTPSSSLSQLGYSAESEKIQETFAGNTFNYYYSLRGEAMCGSVCDTFSGARAANGTLIRLAVITQPHVYGSYSWDSSMGVPINRSEVGCGSDCPPVSSWTYDLAGREVSEQGPIGATGGQGGANRCYDVENHITSTNGGNCGNPTGGGVVAWGPNGHPIVIGTFDPGGGLHNETLHWDGNQLLFATRLSNGRANLDQIKVDAQGDILPNDTGYNDLTFYDRNPSGAVMGCHNKNGTASGGITDIWLNGRTLQGSNVGPCYNTNGVAMPTSIDWFGTTLVGGPQAELGSPIGRGGAFGMPRTDGFTDGFNTIQGVRTYNGVAGVWTTPDLNPGVTERPTSQKSYVWNGNDPVAYSDPSGYDEVPYLDALTPGATPQECGDCNLVADTAQCKGDACFDGKVYHFNDVLPIIDNTVHQTLEDTLKALRTLSNSVTLGPDGELGSEITCLSDGCFHGLIYVGGMFGGNPTVPVPITPDSSGKAIIWHEHPPGADESSVYGHNRDNRNDRAENPTLKTLYIYTQYKGGEYLQIYRGNVPDDFTMTPMFVPLPP